MPIGGRHKRTETKAQLDSVSHSSQEGSCLPFRMTNRHAPRPQKKKWGRLRRGHPVVRDEDSAENALSAVFLDEIGERVGGNLMHPETAEMKHLRFRTFGTLVLAYIKTKSRE